MKERAKIGVLVALLALWAWLAFRGSEDAGLAALTGAGQSGARTSTAGASARVPDAHLRTDRLDSAGASGEPKVRRNIFEYGGRPQVVAAPPPIQDTPPPPPVRPPPPPVRFYGFSEPSRGGDRRVFLTDGEEIYVVAEGEVIQRRYRLVKVNKDSVEVEEVGGARRWTVPLEGG